MTTTRVLTAVFADGATVMSNEETWGIGTDERRCDSCDRPPPVRFSPDHGAHFCPTCWARENKEVVSAADVSGPVTPDEPIEVWHDFDGGPPDRSEWERVKGHIIEPTSPAAAGEVRVEWGVRWWTPTERERWFDSERDRDAEIDYIREAGAQTARATRTTSPWVPVTDDQASPDAPPDPTEER